MVKDKKKKKIGRRLQGKEVKQVSSIRLEPRKKAKILRSYKSLQAWVDEKFKEEFEGAK